MVGGEDYSLNEAVQRMEHEEHRTAVKQQNSQILGSSFRKPE